MKSLGATEHEDLLASPTKEDISIHRPESSTPTGDLHSDPGHPARQASLDNNFGRLVLDEGKSRYVNNSFWANLSNEVEDIKTILHDESDDEHDLPSPSESPHDSPADFVFHHGSPGHDRTLPHPPPHIIQLFWNKYEENVDPLIKMLHLPSTRAIFQALKDDAASIPKHHEPLVFAIYYAAVTSLTCEESKEHTGEVKWQLQVRYRRYVERALAKEHFLSTEEIVVLQALVLFLLSLRRNEHPRVLWSLTGLVTRISMTMGLHREPSLFDLGPYDTEVRRRLWWQICNLDVRLSEDHGSDPGILEHSFDTKYPLNIDDADYGPDMPATIHDKQGVTDMTFSLIRFEVSNTFRRLSYCPPQSGPCKDGGLSEVTIKDKEQWIEECHRSLEEKYLRYCDMTIPMHWVIGTVARLIMAKMWLLIYQPYQRLDGGASLPQETRDRLFVTSLESIEYALLLETEVRTVKWGWLFKSYSQWHALAFLLSELCHRTKGPTVHRAWLAVEQTITEMRGRVPVHRRESIMRPLGRLMAKARAARDDELEDHKMSQSSNPWAQQDATRGPWDPQRAGGANAFGAGTGFEKPSYSLDSPSTSSVRSFDSKPHTSTTFKSNTPDSIHNASSAFAKPNTSNPTVMTSHFDPNWTVPQARYSNLSNNPQTSSGPEFAPSPFFANQPPVQPPAWSAASGADNALLNDFFMGESFQNPNMPRTGLTPVPSNSNIHPGQQAISKDLGMLSDTGFASSTDGPGGPNVAVMNNIGAGPAFNGNVSDNPMVSGADVAWEDWDDMVKEFGMETQGAADDGAKRPGPGTGDMWF